MNPRGKNLILINSIIILIFAGFAFLVAYMSFILSGPEGAYLFEQMGAMELIETVPGISIEDVLNVVHVIGVICVIVGAYQLLLGVLGLAFAKNPKRAPILIALGSVPLIFQSYLVFMLLFSNPSGAMVFAVGLIVYALFFAGAIRNLRPHISYDEPMILGPSSEELMAEVVMGDEEG